MKVSVQTKPRGIALFIVMIAIFVLSVMAAIFAMSMKVETKLAQNADHEQQLLWLGRSGVELARYDLALEGASVPYDSLDEFWAGGPGAPQESNSPLSSISLQNYPVGGGTVSVKIIDLDRKLNINTASPAELQQALNLMGVGADNISVISDSILDWISPGDNPRLAGAKSDYYQSLNPPYYCKDAPMDNLSELLLVRGIRDHPEIYWGGSASNHEPAAFQHKLGFVNSPFQAPDYPFGLKDIFTTISGGRINILTADTNVLQMLPGVDGAIAQNIVKVRPGSGDADDSENGSPFSNPGLAGPGLTNPSQVLSAAGAPPADANYCTVRSFAFKVEVTARIGDYHREYVAILYRNSPTDIKVLSFYWK